MSKALLIFELPCEEEEHWSATHGGRLASAIREVNEEYRRIVKYNSENLPEEALEAIDRARQILLDTLHNDGLGRVFE